MTPAPDDPRYPIGAFAPPDPLTPTQVDTWIDEIAALPGALRRAVAPLTEHQLDTPYRPGGWTVRQVVHHVADSHMNAYVRTKLAATEHAPEVKPYDEVAWSKLGDAALPLHPSLELTEALHARWSAVLRALTPAELERPWRVPNAAAPRPLWRLPLTYAWHGDHHVAQIRQARDHFGI